MYILLTNLLLNIITKNFSNKTKTTMEKTELKLLNNKKLITEIETDISKGTQSIKTFIINDSGEVDPDSATITCICNGMSVTRICSRDGYCDCTSGSPRVVCV
ncbi:hypothetical protein FF52_15922 [Flavobacterium sp. F52]|nr:hypothetical protein FF52_15922 [Flavobacterium sp. F52]